MHGYVFLLALMASTLVAGDAAVHPTPLAKELVQKMTDVVTWNPWQGGDYFRLTTFSVQDYPGLTTIRYENGNFTFSPIRTNGDSTISSVGGNTIMKMPILFVNVSGNYQSFCVGQYPDDKFQQIVTSSDDPDVGATIRIRIDDECNGSIVDVTVAGPVSPFKVTSKPPTGPCPRGMSEGLSFHYLHGIKNQTEYVIRAALTTSLANFKMC